MVSNFKISTNGILIKFETRKFETDGNNFRGIVPVWNIHIIRKVDICVGFKNISFVSRENF